MNRQTPWAAIGPGLVWAGTAVGVSHLVQSTRAGAGYGLALLSLVLFANLFKMPAYSVGPVYAAATGRSLLEGYRRRGRWALVLFVALTLATMFTVIGAVTFVAAGMAAALISSAVPIWGWSAILLSCAVVLLLTGGFSWLERFMTAMMLVLSMTTVVSVVLLLPSVDWAALPADPFSFTFERKDVLFLAALVGWMPSALDTSVWHSLWSLEREDLTVEGAKLDFRVGYVGTTVLALIFVMLGAGLLHSAEVPGSSIAFATLLVDSYTAVLGPWSRPIILVAAFATMLSTTVAVTDGFPRAFEAAVHRFRSEETGRESRTWVYAVVLVGSAIIAQAICVFFLGQLTALVDLATALTGVTAPGFAILNLMTIRGEEVPVEHRPTGWGLLAHIVGVVFLLGMAGLYLWARFILV